jgi:hypothetical protein
VYVERLDSILESKKIKVGLLKMDAQGFECIFLEGMGGEVTEKIDVMKFQYADLWLFAHGCMDLLPQVMNFLRRLQRL